MSNTLLKNVNCNKILYNEKNNQSSLIGQFYYRIYNTDLSRNNSIKQTIQYQGSTITEIDTESVRLAISGISENDTDIENTYIHITTSNIFTSSKSSISSISNHYRELHIESISYFDNNDNSIIAKCVYNDGTFEESNITKLDKLTFTVTGATGKFKNANKIVIEYLNDIPYKPRICSIYS